MNIRIGCSGWSYPEWQGIFYPKDLPQKDWFSFYAHHFDCVEINNTFYNFPTIKTIHKWYSQAPDKFRYCLKANRLITHYRRFENVSDPLHHFYEVGASLKEKVETFLFQLPPSFIYNPRHFQLILNNLDCRFHNVLEFRHPSWWNKNVYETLIKHNIIFCSVSAPGLPDEVLCMNGNVYVRLHGIPLYKACYTEEELFAWAARIKQTNAKNVWVYFNNTMDGYAPINAMTLKRYLIAAIA